MSGSKLLSSVLDPAALPLLKGMPCDCLADFFRQEILKHHACLERQREYFSETAIGQAEEALMRILAQVDCLCQREDACQVIGDLLRKFDAVTNLSAWTDLQQTH